MWLTVAGSIRFSLGRQDVGMMRQPVEQGRGELFVAKDLHPFTEGQICWRRRAKKGPFRQSKKGPPDAG